MLYGMGAALLAMRIEKPTAVAAAWIRRHHHRYATFWKFAQRAIDHLMRGGSLETELGWHLHPCKDPNPRSLANFPIKGQRRRNFARRMLSGDRGRLRSLRAGA